MFVLTPKVLFLAVFFPASSLEGQDTNITLPLQLHDGRDKISGSSCTEIGTFFFHMELLFPLDFFGVAEEEEKCWVLSHHGKYLSPQLAGGRRGTHMFFKEPSWSAASITVRGEGREGAGHGSNATNCHCSSFSRFSWINVFHLLYTLRKISEDF